MTKFWVYFAVALFALLNVLPTYEITLAIGQTSFAGVAFVLLATTMLFIAAAHVGLRQVLARRSR